MSWIYRYLIRPSLFALDSEQIHNVALHLLSRASQNPGVTAWISRRFQPPTLPVELWGLRFGNPLGLAAGMDKRGVALPAWHALGFGFAEIGGVTWHPQPGNPKPRMFRIRDDDALINRMGFNNPGAEAMAESLGRLKLSGRWPDHPVGINLGKSKSTPLLQAAEDYGKSFRALWSFGDFFVINVSSPNTPNLRQLQDKSALDEILAEIQRAGAEWVVPIPKPVLVKIAPDLSLSALDELLQVCASRGVAGIVATNTTESRPRTNDVRSRRLYAETGGLSGRPLRDLSTERIRHIYRQTRGRLPIIGVGGVFDADDALIKILAGASLVQVYTGLVFEGPGIARQIVAGLRKRLDQEGFKTVAEAVGAAVR